MQKARFKNWTDRPFTGYWNGKAKTYGPGEGATMPLYLAAHYAKHLANRELLRRHKDGTLVHEGGEAMTSPKKPEEMPLFQKFLQNAVTPSKEEIETGDESDDPNVLAEIEQDNEEQQEQKVDGDSEPSTDGDDEDNFEGKPKDNEGDTQND